MSRHNKLRAYYCGSVATALLGALAASPASAAPCNNHAPQTTETKCIGAIVIPGNPLLSFDISWVNPTRAEYYLSDRSNSAIEVIDTQGLKFKRQIYGFVGTVIVGGKVDNNHSGPDGVTSHGRWVYAGDGNSTLKVIDLDTPLFLDPIKQSINTGGTTRVDEMSLTPDGKTLVAANNAEDPPFATMFVANGDQATSNVTIFSKLSVDPTIIPPGAGLSLEQPTYDPTTKRFFNSIPIIANNPPGCSTAAPVTCHGGLLVIDPTTVTAGTQVYSTFNPTTNTGVIALANCSPNGATVGAADNLMLGCTPGNNPSDTTTLIINATTKNYANVGGITGSDEVWYNSGDERYYLGASKAAQGPVLGVVDETSVLVETVPVSSGSHSVAADSKRNLIFSPQVAASGIGHDTTTNGATLCGGSNGCIAVFKHSLVDRD